MIVRVGKQLATLAIPMPVVSIRRIFREYMFKVLAQISQPNA